MLFLTHFLFLNLWSAAPCDFHYDRFGEHLYYSCKGKKELVVTKEKKLFINGVVASSQVHQKYHEWQKEKEGLKKKFKGQKDQFLCH